MATKKQSTKKKKSELKNPKRKKNNSSDTEDGNVGNLSDAELSFGCFNMSKGDFHAIRNFIQGIQGGGWISRKPAPGKPLHKFDVQTISNLLVDVLGEYVGTTAKDQEDDDPLAFITLLPLNARNLSSVEGVTDIHRKSVQDLLETILRTARHSNGQVKHVDRLQQSLERHRSALLLHERFMNLPIEIGAPLYQQLLDDLSPAIEESVAFDPEYVLLLVPTYREIVSSLDDKPSKRSKPNPEDENSPEEDLSLAGNPDDYQFYYGEHELLANLCDHFWDVRVKTSHETTDSRRAFGERGVDAARRFYLLTRSNFELFVQQCQNFLS